MEKKGEKWAMSTWWILVLVIMIKIMSFYKKKKTTDLLIHTYISIEIKDAK